MITTTLTTSDPIAKQFIETCAHRISTMTVIKSRAGLRKVRYEITASPTMTASFLRQLASI